jgi:Cu+-exporting ATPase
MEESYGLQDYSDGQPIFTLDPVCGTKLDEAKAPHKTGYAGEIYYFCSVDCKTKFEEDPALYIGQRK